MRSDGVRIEEHLNVRTYIRPVRARILRTAVLSLTVAQVEAASLLLLVPIAQTLTEGERTISQGIGPIDIRLTVSAAAVLCLALLAIAFALTMALARAQAQLMGMWEQQERDRLLKAYMAADWSVQSAVRAGRVQGLSSYATRGGVILGAVVTGIRGLASIVIFVGLSFAVDWRSAIGLLLVGLGLFGILRPLSRRIRNQNRTMAREQLQYGDAVTETASMAREIRVFGAWEPFEGRLLSQSASLGRLRRRTQFLSQALAPTYQYGGLVVIVAALLLAASRSSIEIADLGAIAVLMLRSLTYANSLQGAWQQVLDATPFLERLHAAEAEFSTIAPHSGAVQIDGFKELKVCNVSFNYSAVGSQGPALDGVSFALRAGEVVGIVGPSGAGKSTLAEVLLRLRRPTEGHIDVDGIPATEVASESWTRHVTFVPQLNVIFHGTVADNIGFLVPDATPEMIEDAARRAQIHDVIKALPNGYATQIGATTRDLSGGQVQRIGIARAFARHPSLLVLDEPTSALDVHSEAAIHNALSLGREDLILVVIAHRMSTLSICDRIIVMESGRITADGPMQDIAKSSEFFRSALETGTLRAGQ